MNRGIVYGASAYVLWGVLPLYWKHLQSVPAIEILAHRMSWSLGVVLLLLLARRRWRWLPQALTNVRVLLTFTVTALVLALNWGLYIWGVNTERIVETSLGYFINPLVNVVLGVVFLKERLRGGQLVAIFLALMGVLYLAIAYGRPPWIALVLATSFGVYGLLRKTASLGSLEGLSLETLLLFFPAAGYLIFLAATGAATFGPSEPTSSVLLALTGMATALPLLMFAAAARRVTLTTLGLLQYVAPTLQFTIGVLVYGEPLGPSRLLGFAIIWFALAVYSVEGFWVRRRLSRQHLV